MIALWRTSEVSDAALWLAIILAPLAGASANLYMLPVLGAIVSVAFVSSVLEHRREGHRFYLFALPFALAALSLFTLLQTVPLPGALLGLISPRAHELRTFVGETGWGPISYEPAATAREAAKLVMYAMIAHAAADRARLRKSYELVAAPVVIAGIASLAVAAVQRALHVDRMLGFLPSMRSPSTLLTTFVNANHAAGFLVIVSLTAVGQSLVDVSRTGRRYIYAAAGVITAVGSALCFSRGGLGALIGAYALSLLLLFVKRRSPEDQKLGHAGVAAGVVILCAAIGVFTHYGDLLHAFEGTEADPLGVSAKLAAVKDALPMILDHKWTGIGRGSYVSAYPAYKTSAFQVTFTHPENIVAEVFSDWGLGVGALALLGLLAAILQRVRHAASPAVLFAVIGVLLVTGQNLVDFSLELPGMAIPVAALLGAATPRELVFKRLWPRRKLRVRALVVVPTALIVLGTFFAFARGDLELDQHVFELAVRNRRWDRTTRPTASDYREPYVVPPIEKLVKLAARHPANPLLAAQLSYLAETSEPPDYPTALHLANRTLYLAPTYADGHISVGRLLIRGGHRAQGFEHLRRGWELATEEHTPGLIRHVLQLAKTIDELKEAIPRRDAGLDEIDERQIARAIPVLEDVGKNEWAHELMILVSPEKVASGAAVEVAKAAMLIDDFELARRLAELRLERSPGDKAAASLLVDILWEKKDMAELDRVLDKMLKTPELDPTPFLRMRVQSAIREGEVERAQHALDQLQHRMSPTLENQVEIARLEASLDEKAGLPQRAIRALDRAIQLAPGNAGLRYARAEALVRIGRVTEARGDLEAILRMDPTHKGARNLISRLSAPRPTSILRDEPDTTP